MSKLLFILSLLAVLTIANGSNANQCEPACKQTSPGCCSCSKLGSFCYNCLPGYSINNGNCDPNVCSDANCKTCDKNGECIVCNPNYSVNPQHGCTKLVCGDNCAFCIENPLQCIRCNLGYAFNSAGTCVSE